MSDELHATMVLTDEKIRYAGSFRDLPAIVTDYPPPVTAHGVRRSEHPLTFRAIQLEVAVASCDATEADLEEAFRLAEGTYCPVLALIEGNVDLTHTVKLLSV